MEYIWKKVYTIHDMPKDRTFLSVWGGFIAITAWDEEEKCFVISYDPVEFWAVCRVPPSLENRFYFWGELPKMPKFENGDWVDFKEGK